MPKVILGCERIFDIWECCTLNLVLQKKENSENLLNVSPETSLLLDSQYAVLFFTMLDNSMGTILISEDMAEKILTMEVWESVDGMVLDDSGLLYWIYLELDRLADDYVKGEDDSSDDSGDEKEKIQKQLQDIEFIINCVFKIVKGYDELEKSFIITLAAFINQKLGKIKQKNGDKVHLSYGYKRALSNSKFIAEFVLQILRKKNMVEYEKLFIGRLDEDIKDIKAQINVTSASIAAETHVVKDKLPLDANKKSENKKIDAVENSSNVKYDATVKFNNNTDNNLNNVNNDNINNNRNLNEKIIITRNQNQSSNNDIKRDIESNLDLDKTQNINNNLNQSENPQCIPIEPMCRQKQNMQIFHAVSETIIDQHPVYLCKSLEQAYINSDMVTIDSLIRTGDLLNAIREGRHFCYYVCILSTMLPTKEYESVKQNFSNFECFKIWLYRLLFWWFFRPKPKDAGAIVANIADSTGTTIEKNYHSPRIEKGEDKRLYINFEF